MQNELELRLFLCSIFWIWLCCWISVDYVRWILDGILPTWHHLSRDVTEFLVDQRYFNVLFTHLDSFVIRRRQIHCVGTVSWRGYSAPIQTHKYGRDRGTRRVLEWAVRGHCAVSSAVTVNSNNSQIIGVPREGLNWRPLLPAAELLAACCDPTEQEHEHSQQD